ncbi:MAG: Gluconate 5-dehydrogenase [Devosia sp.]|nr:Gluconate 5-dehydrogenase [Devosia sp.]
MRLFDLTDQVALVTGSSQGIGFALAKGLAAAGAHIVLNGRDANRIEAAAEMLRGQGAKIAVSAFDVTDPQAAELAVDAIEHDVGPIRILVNNAGIQHRAPLHEFPDDKWHGLLRTNLDSVFYMSRAVAIRMIPRKAGKIINIASVNAELGRPGIAPYTATKGAVKQLTRGMACDWARYNLQVNAIGPGYFNTEMTQSLVRDPDFTAWLEKRTPAGRWGDASELVGVAVFLASDASSFVNGQIIYVDGGMTASV